MKRSAPLARRTPLAPGGPLRRRKAPLRSGSSLSPGEPLAARTSGLAPMSARRRREAPTRRAVRLEVLARDRYCQAPLHGAPGPCWHPAGLPLDVHEVVRRSRWRAGYLDPSNCLAVCRAHHDWIGANDGRNGEARRLGLSKPLPPPG